MSFAWLITPNVAPWQGLLAAILALVIMHIPIWPLRAKRLSGRMVRLILFFLLLLWLLQIGFGGGKGTGSGSGIGPGEGEQQGTSSVTIHPGEMPTGTPANILLIIQFVPSPADPKTAVEFACNLIRKEGNQTNQAEIRAKSMTEFDRTLVQQLNALSVSPQLERPEARIDKKPFPGEGVIRKIQQKIQTAHPKLLVSIGE